MVRAERHHIFFTDRLNAAIVGYLVFTGILLFAAPFLRGQVLEFKNVVKLPSQINSAYEEAMPLLSPDSKTLFFTRILHPDNTGGLYGGSDIWQSRFDPITQTWSPASNKKTNFNTKGNNSLTGINKKGDVFYMLNTWGLFFIKKNGTDFSKPEQIHIPDFKEDGFIGAFVSPDYDVVLLSMDGSDSEGEEDIYVCLKDARGNWTSPHNLGSTINTKGFEISPFLSPDKKRLYFASNGHGGEGDADIFYSDRLYDSWDIWSAPVNLGQGVNSTSFDGYYSMYGDTVAYFASNRDGTTADLYQAKVGIGTQTRDFSKKFVSAGEMKELTGGALLEMKFDRNSTTLNTAQNELLFYLVNKIITIQELKVQVVMQESELTAERLHVISDKLKVLGLGGYRIDVSTVRATEGNGYSDGVARFFFFR